MNLLSIQSHVAYGHVGNSAAVFPLQRLGVEVWSIHSVQFSNHTGYGDWRGRVFDAGLIRELVEGIAQRGALGECDGVLSGYIGGADIGAAILDAVGAVKRANPAARYCCDPVIGDVGRGVFVRDGIPQFMKEQAVPAADIVTSNQFELDYLAGRESRTLGDVLAAVGAVQALGPRAVLVTSLHVEETPRDCVDLVAADARRCFRLRTPKLPLKANGVGDGHRRSVLRPISARRRPRRGAVARRLRDLRHSGQDRGNGRIGNADRGSAAGDRRAEPAVCGGKTVTVSA